MRWFKAMVSLKRAELCVSLEVLGACDLKKNTFIDQFKFGPRASGRCDPSRFTGESRTNHGRHY